MTDGETNKQTERQRETDRLINRQTDRGTDTLQQFSFKLKSTGMRHTMSVV